MPKTARVFKKRGKMVKNASSSKKKKSSKHKITSKKYSKPKSKSTKQPAKKKYVAYKPSKPGISKGEKIRKLVDKAQKIGLEDHKIKKPDSKEGKKRVEHLPTQKDYTTKIDSLYKLVEKEEKIYIKELAEKVGITIEKTEEWTKILSKQGMLEIKYPLVGDIVIVKKGYVEKKDGKKVKLSRKERRAEKKRLKQEAKRAKKEGKSKESKPDDIPKKKKRKIPLFVIILLVLILIFLLLFFILVKGGYLVLA